MPAKHAESSEWARKKEAQILLHSSLCERVCYLGCTGMARAPPPADECASGRNGMQYFLLKSHRTVLLLCNCAQSSNAEAPRAEFVELLVSKIVTTTESPITTNDLSS